MVKEINDQWIVCAKGYPYVDNWTTFELSIVRENFLAGKREYGHEGPNKKIIVRSDSKVDEAIYESLLLTAHKICHKYNMKDRID